MGMIDSLSVLEVLDRQNDFYATVLKEQKEHRAYLGHVLEKGIWAISVLFVVATAVFGFFGFNSWQSFKKAAEGKFSRQADKLLTQQLAFFDKNRIEPLKQQLHVLQQYKSSTILFLGQTEVLNELKAFIEPIFNRSGMYDLVFSERLNNGEFQNADIIVLHYDSDYSISLETILRKLHQKVVPVVIYSPSRDRQTEAEQTALKLHQWYTFANMPLSLVTQIFNAASVFYGTRT